ncbi:hypothetical protein IFM89_005891 [Coptis chinensis]|uniref:Uncharacterized protein n=1 Tax=Coptis chinensis TaxID=261450 RepID=A0A835HNW1_9MAGN|nr:hypothetical protein IFM89_005891 [Coptis chinensis]
MMSRSCSHCGHNGHNSRTCTENGGALVTPTTATSGGGFMLFGVRVAENSFRKSVSMNNLSQYEQLHESNSDIAAGYASDDVVHTSDGNRERKRGKGDWRGISRNYVKTRTPTQVASHAQKYFLRRSNQNRRRRRSSLFDITAEEERPIQSPQQLNSNFGLSLPIFSLSFGPENTTLGQAEPTNTHAKVIRPIPILPIPPSSRMEDLNLNQNTMVEDSSSLSLKLCTPEQQQQCQSSPSRHSAFQAMSNFSSSGDLDPNGGSIISVA